MLSDRMLFAVPKKGRLYEQVMHLLSGADIQFVRKQRLDIAVVSNFPMALVFLPAADIPKFVAEGNVDIGITGQDMISESNVDVDVKCLYFRHSQKKNQVIEPETRANGDSMTPHASMRVSQRLGQAQRAS